MQLRSPASARAGRLVSLGVVSLLVTLTVLLTGCEPRTGLGVQPPIGGTDTEPVDFGGPVTIVALGDSYSSGEGNVPFDTDAPGCRRGGAAWPRLLGQRIASSDVRLLACSGATTAAFTTSFHGQPPQVEALRALVASGVRPTIVTITIGGNDAGFGRTVTSCVVWRCFWNGNDDQSREFVTDTLPPLLESAYSAVKEAAPEARILVVGYPELIPNRSDNICKWLDNNERQQLTGLNNDLNRVARRAAHEVGVEFLSLNGVFDGHQICTTDAWVYPVAVTGAGLQASAHPNAQGQQAIADAVYKDLAKGK
ncbi:SGNH/GDSL hydrolase family protein [Frankia sp. CNm7]|uniref:SGNH/GDSL hydrolase family protein n=1 Tax=Frankia nepalensis TaxID=1836974 RepID=A0A937RFL2_9ACTN|nr:SGNH/GDSL hydrolase family protein [Frankia nepalensis]MBL7501224.1 SGNH/GDSL hydrolase family protein [Frankia nepalensis]MBL7512115.1 SGNH/GDSL hydrolase family protein [Frankia nepalensis]MBL7519230.1 SGNH/GDSL hydrolase family protein [Frankia nepalensis]MBL7629510.1 SGNH/GDSL hydrolase family protein [Frankia nepalensis]